MKTPTLIFALIMTITAYAQPKKPHGMVYGSKPDTTQVVAAEKLDDLVGKRARISTTVKGKVLKVTDAHNGWFEIDAGKGHVIKAYFSRAGISIPKTLAGKTVIADGVAKKQIASAAGQHFAGDRNNGHQSNNADNKDQLSMEVRGLMIY